MNPEQHLQPERLLSYMLGQLPTEEAEQVRQHLRDCATCTEELHRVESAIGELALTSGPAELPSGGYERFLRRLRREGDAGAPFHSRAAPESVRATGSAAASVPFSQPAAPRSSLAWAGWLAAAVLLVALLGSEYSRHTLKELLAQRHGQEMAEAGHSAHSEALLHSLTEAGVVRASLAEPKVLPRPAVRVLYAPRTGALLLVASSLRPLRDGKVYELWILPAAPALAPVRAGTFRPDSKGAASLLLPNGPATQHPKAFAITVEPDGGSAVPTLPIVLAGDAGD